MRAEEALRAGRHIMEVSRPQKVLFPEDGITPWRDPPRPRSLTGARSRLRHLGRD